jgi:hypothetical protein
MVSEKISREPLPGRKTPINVLEELALELVSLKPEITAHCFEPRLNGCGTYMWFNVRNHTHVIKIDHEFTVAKWEAKMSEIAHLFKKEDEIYERMKNVDQDAN